MVLKVPMVLWLPLLQPLLALMDLTVLRVRLDQ